MSLFGFAVLLFLASCISRTNDLDLDKEISYDMRIAPGGFAIPLGNIEKILVDSLIKTDDDGSALVSLPDGQYGITMEGSIDKVDAGIDEITLEVDEDALKINAFTASFDDPTPGSIKIDERENGTEVSIPEINLDEINSRLPLLKSDTSCTYPIPGIPGTGMLIPVEIPIRIDNSDNPMAFGFSYDLPADVDVLNAVWLGKQQGSHDGQKITLNVNMSGLFTLIEEPEISIKSLIVDFPDNFTISKDASLYNYVPEKNVNVVDGHKFSISMDSESVTGLSKTNPVLPITLYVSKADFSSDCKDGRIEFSESVVYSLDFIVKGQVELNEPKVFDVSVSLNEQMQMSDIDASVKTKSVDMSQQSFSSQFHITGLDDISSINTVTFDDQASVLNISLSDFPIAPFSLSSESVINLVFPEMFTFGDECLTQNGVPAGSWDGNILKIDPSKAMGETLTIHPVSLDASSYQINQDATMDIPVEFIYDGHFETEPKSDVSLTDLTDAFGSKSVTVKVWGNFKIDNAEVVTKSIVDEFNEESSFEIDEEVDKALRILRKVEFREPAAIDVKLMFSGVPNTITGLDMSDFEITFPSFLKMKYSGSDSRISLSGNILSIDGILNASELSEIGNGFVIQGLAVDGMEFNPELKTKDGRIVINDEKVIMKGKVKVENQIIQSKDLEDITVTPTVKFAKIKVKSVTGQVDPQIDPVHESVAISLSDDIDFLKDDKNRLSLKDPQITLNLTSSITVPIKLDLSISSKDKDGKTIKEDIGPDEGSIIIPACDPEKETRNVKLVLLNHNVVGNQDEDIVYVRINRLSELMTTIPDSVIFDLKASADQSVEHVVDLDRDLYVLGDYTVSVPLSFDDMFIEYNDTIKDLSEDMEDISDVVSAADVELNAKVTSTIPFGIKLSFKALDKMEHPVNDITLEQVTISPGSTAGTTSEMKVRISVKNNSLKLLDALVISAQCESSTDGASIKKGQYIELSDMKLLIHDGIDLDLTDKLNNKD